MENTLQIAYILYLLIVAILDILYYRIYNILTGSMLLLGMTYNILINGIYIGVTSSIIYGFLGGIIIIIIDYLYSGGIGGGDIKYIISIGAWLADARILVALVVAFELGGLVGICMFIMKIVNRKSKIPFGPFISIGGGVGMFWGNELIKWSKSIF